MSRQDESGAVIDFEFVGGIDGFPDDSCTYADASLFDAVVLDDLAAVLADLQRKIHHALASRV